MTPRTVAEHSHPCVTLVTHSVLAKFFPANTKTLNACQNPRVPHGDRLTGLDTSFLQLEGRPRTCTSAACAIFDGPAPAYDDLVETVAARLHLVPRYRQRLALVPLGQGRPVWVDDPQFRLPFHVRHTALPGRAPMRNCGAWPDGSSPRHWTADARCGSCG